MEYVIYFVLFALSVSLFIGVIYFIIVDMYKKMVFYKRANNAIYQNKYSYSQKLAWITFFCILSIFFLRLSLYSDEEYDCLPKNAIQMGADIVIHSVHKTLPSMTQTALIHVQGDIVDKTVYRVVQVCGIHQTSCG